MNLTSLADLWRTRRPWLKDVSSGGFGTTMASSATLSLVFEYLCNQASLSLTSLAALHE